MPSAASSTSDADVAACGPGFEADFGWAVAMVARGFHLAAGRKLADQPGGLRGFLVLAVVAAGRPPSQLALAQQLAVDKTAMTYLLDELEEAGLVQRQPDPADRRARQILLTPAGADALATARAQLAEVDEAILAPLSATEAATFRAMLQRIARAAQTGPDAVGCG